MTNQDDQRALTETDDGHVLTERQREESPELRWVDGLTQLLDTRFVIPGTSVRFGADFVMGLVPGAGDVVSMALSGLLIATMAKKGASPLLVARMLINVILDTVVGTIPILGNIFDLYYKANHRNLLLMREYYDEGKHTGSVWPLVITVVVVMLLLLAGTFFLLSIMFNWIWSLFQ